MTGGDDDEERRAADIEVGASVRMRKVHVKQKRGVRTSTSGTPSRETETVDERENLPERIKPGETYRKAWIRKHVEVRLPDDV